MADPDTSLPLQRASVVEAHKVVMRHVHRTPVMTSRTLSALASRQRSAAELEGTPWAGTEAAAPRIRIWLKCENLQRIGAFKVRGAFYALDRLTKEDGWEAGGGRERGVVTHSSGNHAQALALAAREHGIRARVVMPASSVPHKVAATRGYGAEVIFSGSTSSEREAVTAEVVAQTGARLVPPYDHPDIILGQGTLGLELQEQVGEMMAAAARDEPGATARTSMGEPGPEPGHGDGLGEGRRLQAIITPCGGGGMLSGTALSCEGTGIRVFGAEPSFEGADDGCRGFEAGQRIDQVASQTMADGLRTPVGIRPWAVMHTRRLVAGMYSVTEAEIGAAMRLLLERCKLVVEPSACVGLAVVFFNEAFRRMVAAEAGERGWDLAVVLSGGNVDIDAIGSLARPSVAAAAV